MKLLFLKTKNWYNNWLCSLFLVIAILPGKLSAQTCCSGGVPLSANLGLPPSEANTLQLTLSYDLNVLETLKTGRTTLEDQSRTRRTHSSLLEFGYSFSKRFAIDGFFSWVRQERKIEQFGNRDFTATEGIGDAVLLMKYRVLDLNNSNTVVTTGFGIKFPLGASNLSNEDGLQIIADLQPGSGAWDNILWAQLVHNFGFRPSMSLSVTSAYSVKGKNKEYLGSQSYQFGNEWQLIAGISDRLFLGKLILDPSLALRYRTVPADRLNELDLPSTGGNWIFINPGATHWITPAFSFNANVELPLSAYVDGTQASPSYRINTGLFYRFNLGPHYSL